MFSLEIPNPLSDRSNGKKFTIDNEKRKLHEIFPFFLHTPLNDILFRFVIQDQES
jgi:hypothetical protein